MPVSFTTVDIQFSLSQKNTVKKWIKHCIHHNNYSLGSINIAFCSDEYILKVNNVFLNHNYYTDIITFPYSSGRVLSGDILISIDTVSSNATKFSQPFQKELLRVIIHGILHLIGFMDSTRVQKARMRMEEDKWLHNYFSVT